MGTIMRGDQTLRLIQLYYNNYPEIARNTQDADGRRARGQMWQQITDELNTSYETSFSVEQYKKKIQNVQCTSRQKIQAGKRNLGVAEFEYLRLFEQERLSTNPTNSDAYESSSMTRSSSADLSTNVKVEQMLEKFGITIDPQVFQSGNFLAQDTQTFETGSASDSDSSNTTTTNPSSTIDSNAPLSSKSPPVFPTLLPTLPNQMDPRQLMFALSQLNQFNQEVCNVGTLNSLPNQLTNNFQKTTPELPTPLSLDEKPTRQQTSPTIKRSLEDNETLMRMFTAKKKRMNGIFGGQGVDEKWKKEMVEVQQKILDNQSKILEYMDQKQAQIPLNQSNFSTIETKLEQLCQSINLLNETLKDGLSTKKSLKVDE